MPDFIKYIRDPIHGYIGITKEELKILSLPIFQRLRQISQLSFVDLVYPDGRHTRFSHSLGALHLCWKYGEHLKTLGVIKHNKDIELLRLCGLLHDIGHGPFSHAFEPAYYDIFSKNHKNQRRDWTGSHKYLGRQIISEKEYGISEILGKDRTKQVVELLQGKAKEIKKPVAFNYIISGLFSADRLDYLQRDAYHTGARELAIIDCDRIIRSMDIESNNVRFLNKGLSALEGAILSYYYLFRSVYYHHTARSAYSLFLKLSWRTLKLWKEKRLERRYFQPKKFIDLTDTRFMEMLQDVPLVKDLQRRNLPRVILGENDFKVYADLLKSITVINDLTKKDEIESKLARKLKAKIILLDNAFFVPYIPPEMAEPEIVINKKGTVEILNLAELSPPVEALKAIQKQSIPRVYIDRESFPQTYRALQILKQKIVEETRNLLA